VQQHHTSCNKLPNALQIGEMKWVAVLLQESLITYAAKQPVAL